MRMRIKTRGCYHSNGNNMEFSSLGTTVKHKPPIGKLSAIASSHSVEELLENSFTEWADRKGSEVKQRRQSLKQQEMKKKELETVEQLRRRERSVDVVEKWKQNKDRVVKEKLKHEMEKKRQDREQKDLLIEKVQCSAESAEKWRQEKIDLLKEKQKKEKEKLSKSECERQEQVQVQMEIAKKAFQIWKEKKDEKRKQLICKQNKENRDKNETELIQKQQRQQQAINVYETWKQQKDKQIKDSRTLYTYNPDPRQPPKGNKWTPARSIKYTYPSLPSSTTKLDSSSTSCSTGKGQLKTIKVCCQTLEYWCTCIERKNEE